MSLAQPNLPGAGVTVRVLRDDGVSWAGVTLPSESYTPGAAVAKLVAMPGLSAAEINRASLGVTTNTTIPREPIRQGPGWAQYQHPGSMQIYILRDDGTHLSYSAPQAVFTPAKAAAVISATSGLTVSEQARISGFLGGDAGPVAPIVPFTLALLPANTVTLDFDPASGVTQSAGNVTAWNSAVGGVNLTKTGGSTYTYEATGWGIGQPSVKSDGVGTGALAGTGNAPIDHAWIFHVAERLTNASVGNPPTGKPQFVLPRAGDGLVVSLQQLRGSSDTPQVQLRVGGIGNTATNFQTRTSWGIGQRSVIVQELTAALSIRGNPGSGLALGGATSMGGAANTSGATTATGVALFGDGVNAGAVTAVRYARLLAIDFDKMPGKVEATYNWYLIRGYLAWLYGTQGELPVTDPFYSRAPLASDYTGNNRLIQTWGNSICNYVSPFINGNFSYSRVNAGLTTVNGGVGGDTTTQIRDRFFNGFNTGTGLTDNTPIADQRRKIVVIGEFFQNGDTGSTSNESVMRAQLAEMVAAVETAQGVAAGQAHLVLWDSWVSWSNLSMAGTALRDTINARNAYLKATYPNYMATSNAGLTVSEYCISLSAPGSPYADPTYYARQQPPIALNRGGDNIHPDDTLSNLIAQQVLAPFIERKGWDK